jgi:hypothetical protein
VPNYLIFLSLLSPAALGEQRAPSPLSLRVRMSTLDGNPALQSNPSVCKGSVIPLRTELSCVELNGPKWAETSQPAISRLSPPPAPSRIPPHPHPSISHCLESLPVHRQGGSPIPTLQQKSNTRSTHAHPPKANTTAQRQSTLQNKIREETLSKMH